MNPPVSRGFIGRSSGDCRPTLSGRQPGSAQAPLAGHPVEDERGVDDRRILSEVGSDVHGARSLEETVPGGYHVGEASGVGACLRVTAPETTWTKTGPEWACQPVVSPG